jgi:copper(I)-binding protein
MREIPSLRLEPGAAVELAPGGYHLMLTMPQESFRPDQPVTVVVTTAGGEAFSFTVPVERR